MSDADHQSPPAPKPPPLPAAAPPQRDGCLTAFMVLAGVILLLPGLCTMAVFNGHADSSMSLIALITSLVAMGGVALIAFALLRTGGSGRR